MTRMTASEAAAKSAENRKRWNTPVPDALDQFEREDESPKPKKPPTLRRDAPRRARKPGKVSAQPKMSEKRVLAGCKDLLGAHPRIALFWRQQTGSTRSPDGKRFLKFSFKGASDLMAIVQGGKFLAVECKSTGKKATALQQAFLDNVLDAGGYAVCVDSPSKLADYLRML